MNETKTKKRRLRKKDAMSVLAAAYNITPGAVPDTDAAAKCVQGIVRGLKRLIEVAGRSEDRLRGVRTAAKLFLELTSVEDIDAYVARQVKQGFEGLRHESEGADIVVTVTSVRTGLKLIKEP